MDKDPVSDQPADAFRALTGVEIPKSAWPRQRKRFSAAPPVQTKPGHCQFCGYCDQLDPIFTSDTKRRWINPERTICNAEQCRRRHTLDLTGKLKRRKFRV